MNIFVYSFFLMLFLWSSTLYGQYQPESYFNFQIGVAAAPLKTNSFSSQVSFNYKETDLATQKTIQKHYSNALKIKQHDLYAPTLLMGFEGGRYNRLFCMANLGVMVSKAPTSYFFDLGVGYHLKFGKSSKIQVHPAVLYSVYETDKEYGQTIDNRNINLQIFGKKFPYQKANLPVWKRGSVTQTYAPNVSIRYRHFTGGAKIQMGLWFFKESRFSCRANLGYFVPLYGNVRIKAISGNTRHGRKYTSADIDYKQTDGTNPVQSIQYQGAYANVTLHIRIDRWVPAKYQTFGHK